MSKECLICGKSLGAFSGKFVVLDGYVCNTCGKKAGLDSKTGGQYSSDVIKEMIKVREQNEELINNFKPTKEIGDISFDDNSKSFILHKKDLYSYNQISSFELLEDGDSITKGGLGSAVAGGVLFGGIGAIVGGVTGRKKTKKICKSLQIKITLKNSPKQTEYIEIISTDTKTDGIVYKVACNLAQETLSALQIAVDTSESSTAPQVNQSSSAADEILKFKKLLDEGIITEEEFKAKKAQLLSLEESFEE